MEVENPDCDGAKRQLMGWIIAIKMPDQHDDSDRIGQRYNHE